MSDVQLSPEISAMLAKLDGQGLLPPEALDTATRQLCAASPQQRQRHIEQVLAVAMEIHRDHGAVVAPLIAQLSQLIADLMNANFRVERALGQPGSRVQATAITKLLGRGASAAARDPSQSGEPVISLLALRAASGALPGG